MFLIATLSSKENELSQCKQSVSEQTVETKQIIYEGYDNVTAHHKVYNLFNNVDSIFTYMCKLDADMRFNDKYVLRDVENYFEKNPLVDHVILPVKDYFTGKHILGIHFFRAGVEWELTNESMFVDPNPKKCRECKVLYKWKNRVDHSFDPDYKQAFLFGVHRTAKMIEALKVGDYSQYVSQLSIIKSMTGQYKQKKLAMHIFAMQGLLALINGDVSHKNYSNKMNFQNNIELIADKVDMCIWEVFYKNLTKRILFKNRIKIKIRQFVHYIKWVIYGYI